MFVFQAINVVERYYRMDKITDIQLKFDTGNSLIAYLYTDLILAPFPSITLCNLNPYKDSLLRDVETVRKIVSCASTKNP